ncbi:MAG: VOC family protein [Bacteroidota bacterium]
MLTDINPKLPMRDQRITQDFYVTQLGFKVLAEYDGYLIVGKDEIEIHFFHFKEIDPKENYAMVYIRVEHIDKLYQSFLDNKTKIHPNGKLEIKPWKQKEFSISDPDGTLLTFGQGIEN